MLRAARLRKLLKVRAQCPEPPMALLGTEVGFPASAGLTVSVLEGNVVATGTGYDFTSGVLSVATKDQCPLTAELTFSITGTGPVPALAVHASPSSYYLLGVLGTGAAYAAYKYPDSLYPFPYWAIQALPVAVPSGVPYELKCSLADTWVGVWLNGNRIARAAVTPGYLATTHPWNVVVGRYTSETYTGYVSSVRLENGALPDIDVLNN